MRSRGYGRENAGVSTCLNWFGEQGRHRGRRSLGRLSKPNPEPHSDLDPEATFVRRIIESGDAPIESRAELAVKMSAERASAEEVARMEFDRAALERVMVMTAPFVLRGMMVGR